MIYILISKTIEKVYKCKQNVKKYKNLQKTQELIKYQTITKKFKKTLLLFYKYVKIYITSGF